jgi:hypothetical protein
MKPKITPGSYKIVIFDLEFYVSAQSRKPGVFCYNPWDKKSKLLGGSFLIICPTKNNRSSYVPKNEDWDNIWIWNSLSEKELVEKIYDKLKSVLSQVHLDSKGKYSPILCGIGITHSDVPVLFELFKRYCLVNNTEAFEMMNKFRTIDISQLAITEIVEYTNYIFPKRKSEILNKFVPDIKFDDGRSVWDLYEAKEYGKIEQRTYREVAVTYECYEKIINDSKRRNIRIINNEKLRSNRQ